MNKAQIKRQQAIQELAKQVIERAHKYQGGSACLVPSSSQPGKKYRVDIDENYVPTACECKGGKHQCMHKLACILYFAPRLAALLNSELNPIYSFWRGDNQIKARLSQFSKDEKAAFREYERQQAKERARAAYNANFDPNGVDVAMYA